ncbi:hypothetical protein [Microvirga arabica]|uniref:hypothetical protein n=1 Tax=Microvirga arabica TaxID=1128671 RepID=UPI00193A399F|nr:hypothetical protein [Microvirga arabica]MBM1170189.1 hypothetical protein [Microvirga arabica]
MSEQKPQRPRYAVIPEEDVQALRTLGREAFGEGWIYRLAQHAGVSTRTAQRWAAGEATIPEGVLKDLITVRCRVDRSGYVKTLRVLVDQALADGLSPHAIAGHLRDEAARVKPEKESTGSKD